MTESLRQSSVILDYFNFLRVRDHCYCICAINFNIAILLCLSQSQVWLFKQLCLDQTDQILYLTLSHSCREQNGRKYNSFYCLLDKKKYIQ